MTPQALRDLLAAPPYALRVGAGVTFDAPFLQSLKSVDLDATLCGVWNYFPAGVLRLGALTAFRTDPHGVRLSAPALSAPFVGMALDMLIGVKDDALFVTVGAHLAPGSAWSVADSYPIYAGQPIAALRLFATSHLRPLLSLASHGSDGKRAYAAMHIDGALDLSGLSGAAHGVFVAMLQAQAGRLNVSGELDVFPGADAFAKDVLPTMTLHGGATCATRLGPLSLEDLKFEASATFRYNKNVQTWSLACEQCWHTQLVLSVLGAAIKLPFSAAVQHDENRLVLCMAAGSAAPIPVDGLASLLPGTPLALPEQTLGTLTDVLSLCQFEACFDTAPGAGQLLECEWVCLKVRTNEALNRWVLIDQVLTLDAIDVEFLVRAPGKAHRAIDITVSGLAGIGERGTLQLATSVSVGPGPVTCRFHGELLDQDEQQAGDVNITEIARQFGVDPTGAAWPNLYVREFWFDCAPREHTYGGHIKLSGDWQFDYGRAKFALENVAFDLDRAGEHETSFGASAELAIGQVSLFVSADYASAAHGWLFKGRAAVDAVITLNDFIESAGALVGVAAPAVPALVKAVGVRAIDVELDTASGDFSFGATVALAFEGAASGPELSLQLETRRASGAGAARAQFSAQLHLLKHDFGATFHSQDGRDMLVASYANTGPAMVGLKELVSQLSDAAATVLPDGLQIGLQHARLAVAGKAAARRFLFAIELGGGIALAGLPLVGRHFDASHTLSLLVQLVFVNGDFDANEVRLINGHSVGASTLPASGVKRSDGAVQVRVGLRLGGKTFPLSIPLSWEEKKAAIEVAPVAQPQMRGALLQWFAVQQAYGPFHFERIGVGLTADRTGLELVLDASLQIGGLTLSLLGLGASYELGKLASLMRGAGSAVELPKFELNGIAVNYTSGPLALGGSLLHCELPGRDEYEGTLTIGYDRLVLNAYASYATVGGERSLLAYGALKFSVRGASFFMIKALSAGFGYNRRLAMPDVKQVQEFPLLALLRESGEQDDTQKLQRLAQHVEFVSGEYFVAAGISFNSFNLIDGTALLSIGFGRELEADLIGMATLIFPAKTAKQLQPSLINAALALTARYRPAAGELKIVGVLTPEAYLFAPQCHLTGGFAFSTWLKGEHAGDFVLTMGGYAPTYAVPTHYPQVPRIGLNWKLDRLSLKAETYFALTPHAIMVGAHLRADWESEDVHATFRADIDCLIGWQPYTYQAQMGIYIGVTYRTWCYTFSAELTARLSIAGPPFHGHAHVEWWAISFDIPFGPTPSNAGAAPAAVYWDDFELAFLPKKSEILALSITSGLAHEQGPPGVSAEPGGRMLGQVHARQLRVTLASAIPVTLHSGANFPAQVQALDVAPMAAPLKSRLTLRVTRDGIDASGLFNFAWHCEAVPPALWKPADASKAEGKLAQALTQLDLVPLPIVAPVAPLRIAPQPIPTRKRIERHLPMPPLTWVARVDDSVSYIGTAMQFGALRVRRQRILNALMPGARFECSALTLATLRCAPHIIRRM